MGPITSEGDSPKYFGGTDLLALLFLPSVCPLFSREEIVLRASDDKMCTGTGKSIRGRTMAREEGLVGWAGDRTPPPNPSIAAARQRCVGGSREQSID